MGKMERVDISKYKGQKYKVLSGVDRGKEVRKELNLDGIDLQSEKVYFTIPEDVYSLNCSFFSGLFQESLKKLGEKRFREKYQFECTDIIRKNIEDGIFYILNTKDLLGGQK